MRAERVNLQADELRQGTVYSRRGNSRSEIRICATRVCALQSCPTLCDPMDYIACQAPLSMGFSRQEHWSGLPCPPPDLPDPGMEPASLMSPALAGRFFTTSATWEAPKIRIQGSKKKKNQKTPNVISSFIAGRVLQSDARPHSGPERMLGSILSPQAGH